MSGRRTLGAAIAGLVLASGTAQAQSAWDARLAISAFPSPYLSDWESNPAIGTLTITNPVATDQNVLLSYRVTDRSGRLLASGRSSAVLIPRGAPTVITDFVGLPGRSQHDQSLEDQMRRTGRLPEGDNTTCVAVTDAGGFVLAEDCATFSIVYPDAPSLIGPMDEAALTTGFPILQWTPLQVPPAFQLTYLVRVSEVLAGQTPLQALVANIPVFETTTSGTSLEYPLGAMPLVEGKTYAWRVQALDQHGYAASSNDGRSEVWTFRFGEGRGATPVSRPMTFALFNAYDAPSGDQAADAGTRNAPAGSPTSYGITGICSNWGTAPDTLQLGVNAPFGFNPLQADRASFYREMLADTAEPNKWWVFAQTSSGRSVLLHGDCTTGRFLSGFQWIAIRKYGRNQNINDWLGTGTANRAVQSVEYGLWVMALHGGTVSAPALFREGSEFLGGRDIEIARGLNGYAEINLREGPLWAMIEPLGYENNRITLQGFVGLDVERSIGVGMGDRYEASVDQQRSFLKLSAAFPERVPFGPLARLASSMQLSLEFEIQDSTGVNVTRGDSGGVASSTKRSLDFIFRLKHTINLREDLFRTAGSRALVGWIGADHAREREQQTRDVASRSFQRLNSAGQRVSGGRLGSGGRVGSFFGVTDVCQPRPPVEAKTDLVINYGLEGRLFLGPVFLEDPALEVHIGARAANGQRDLSFGISSHVGVEGFDQTGILGISRTREYDDGQPPEPGACSPARPRSTTIVGDPTSRPRSDANADQGGRGTLDAPAGSTPGSLHSPWKWAWKVAWDVVPSGGVSKVLNGVLGGLFLALTLGGT